MFSYKWEYPWLNSSLNNSLDVLNNQRIPTKKLVLKDRMLFCMWLMVYVSNYSFLDWYHSLCFTKFSSIQTSHFVCDVYTNDSCHWNCLQTVTEAPLDVSRKSLWNRWGYLRIIQEWFSLFLHKNMLWVLIRITSAGRFQWVPTTHFYRKLTKIILRWLSGMAEIFMYSKGITENTENNWAMSCENLFMPYVNNKGADQPMHLRSLDSIIPLVSLTKISSLYLASMTA